MWQYLIEMMVCHKKCHSTAGQPSLQRKMYHRKIWHSTPRKSSVEINVSHCQAQLTEPEKAQEDRKPIHNYNEFTKELSVENAEGEMREDEPPPITPSITIIVMKIKYQRVCEHRQEQHPQPCLRAKKLERDEKDSVESSILSSGRRKDIRTILQKF